jgi:hypothetical protein
MAARRRILKKSAESSPASTKHYCRGLFKSGDDLRNLSMDEINERYETFKLMSQFEVST